MMPRALSHLPRTVWIIGCMSLLNDCASEMVYPLIPLYLAGVLASSPGSLGIVLGLMEGFADLVASLLKLVSGLVVDRSQRTKPWIVLGYSLAGIGRPFVPLIGSWPWMFAIRVTDRIGKGLRSTPRDALLARSVDRSRHGLVFGFHRALDNAGAVAGPLVASGLLAMGTTVPQVFYLTAVPAALCLLLSLALSDEPMPRRPDAGGETPRSQWHLHALPGRLKRYLVVIALCTLGKSSSLFLLLRARELGIKESQIPLLWAAVSGLAALLSTPLSALSDRVNRTRLLTAGYALYGVIYLSMGFMSQAHGLLFVLFGCYGLFLAATEGVERALVADMAESRWEGTAFGWYNMISGLFVLPASLVFGWLYEAASPRAAFAFSGSCALLAAALLYHWIAPHPPRPGIRKPESATPD